MMFDIRNALHTHMRRSPHVQRLHRLAARHWLAVICLALAAMTILETIGFLAYGIISSVPDIALCLTSALAVALLPKFPGLMPWLSLAIYATGDVSAITMPSAMFLTTLFSIAWLTYHSTWRGFAGAAIPVAASTAIVLSEGGYPPWILASITQYACWYFSFMSIGLLVRKTREYESLKARQTKRQLSERLQVHLHDSAANDLAYAITMIDLYDGTSQTAADDGRETMVAVRNACDDALQQIRKAIDVIRDESEEQEVLPGHRQPGKSEFDPLDRIRAMVDDHERQLQSLGFHGIGIVSGDGYPMPDTETFDVLVSFINEIYGNIIKHADPEEYHIVAVQAAPNGVVVSSSNTRRHKDSDVESEFDTGSVMDGTSTFDHGGTGLDRYRKQLERIGGTLEILEDGDEWTTKALIPYTVNP
ncbi:hypothetical protein JS532_10830 [Bifidobacterium callimiconis]|uniref:histidine kinase n=1 Tax=Bifidobacterium callimiconis TaxID=2306973 RepID=UPI001BDDC091|nr:histidine kinase [Bifidobacterium callimiconis]MBT1178036.1 hypothetical protein [Bifidobacterium callimiconis]